MAKSVSNVCHCPGEMRVHEGAKSEQPHFGLRGPAGPVPAAERNDALPQAGQGAVFGAVATARRSLWHDPARANVTYAVCHGQLVAPKSDKV